jgi:hypothetical protein
MKKQDKTFYPIYDEALQNLRLTNCNKGGSRRSNGFPSIRDLPLIDEVIKVALPKTICNQILMNLVSSSGM